MYVNNIIFYSIIWITSGDFQYYSLNLLRSFELPNVITHLNIIVINLNIHSFHWILLYVRFTQFTNFSHWLQKFVLHPFAMHTHSILNFYCKTTSKKSHEKSKSLVPSFLFCIISIINSQFRIAVTSKTKVIKKVEHNVSGISVLYMNLKPHFARLGLREIGKHITEIPTSYSMKYVILNLLNTWIFSLNVIQGKLM